MKTDSATQRSAISCTAANLIRSGTYQRDQPCGRRSGRRGSGIFGLYIPRGFSESGAVPLFWARNFSECGRRALAQSLDHAGGKAPGSGLANFSPMTNCAGPFSDADDRGSGAIAASAARDSAPRARKVPQPRPTAARPYAGDSDRHSPGRLDFFGARPQNMPSGPLASGRVRSAAPGVFPKAFTMRSPLQSQGRAPALPSTGGETVPGAPIRRFEPGPAVDGLAGEGERDVGRPGPPPAVRASVFSARDIVGAPGASIPPEGVNRLPRPRPAKAPMPPGRKIRAVVDLSAPVAAMHRGRPGLP